MQDRKCIPQTFQKSADVEEQCVAPTSSASHQEECHETKEDVAVHAGEKKNEKEYVSWFFEEVD